MPCDICGKPDASRVADVGRFHTIKRPQHVVWGCRPPTADVSGLMLCVGCELAVRQLSRGHVDPALLRKPWETAAEATD